MSITKILAEKDVEATEKLEKVSAIVVGARKNYGNEDAEFDVPRVDTTFGRMKFDMLEPESQVEILKGEAMRIKAVAAEYVEQTPGATMKRKVEELLATNPLFANISAEADYDYL